MELASGNTVTQSGNTARARPSHLFTGKTDVSTSFERWVLERNLGQMKDMYFEGC